MIKCALTVVLPNEKHFPEILGWVWTCRCSAGHHANDEAHFIDTRCWALCNKLTRNKIAWNPRTYSVDGIDKLEGELLTRGKNCPRFWNIDGRRRLCISSSKDGREEVQELHRLSVVARSKNCCCLNRGRYSIFQRRGQVSATFERTKHHKVDRLNAALKVI